MDESIWAYVAIGAFVSFIFYFWQISPGRCHKCRKFFAGKIVCAGDEHDSKPSLREALLLPGAIVFFECKNCGEYWSKSGGEMPPPALFTVAGSRRRVQGLTRDVYPRWVGQWFNNSQSPLLGGLIRSDSPQPR